MKKIIVLVTLATLLLVNTAVIASAAPQTSENTSSTMQTNNPNTQRQFAIANHGNFTAPSIGSISREYAADIAAESLERLFGADLRGVTLNMFYVEGFGPNNPINLPPQEIELANIFNGWAVRLGLTIDEIHHYVMVLEQNRETSTGAAAAFANRLGVTEFEFMRAFASALNISQNSTVEMPSMWRGFINPSNGYWSTFTFAINAETGELLEATYDPSAAESIGVGLSSGREVDFNDFRNFTPNAQLNYKYSNLAMDIAQELEILSGEVAQARIVTHALGANALSEPVLTVLVEVRSVSGEAVVLGLDTRPGNEPVLSLVRTGVKNFSFRTGGAQQLGWVTR